MMRDRQLHSPLYEKAILGALMVDGTEAADIVKEHRLIKEDFYTAQWANLFELLLSRLEKGLPCSQDVLIEAISFDNDYAEKYGALSEVSDLPRSASDSSHAAQQVRALAMLRRSRKLADWTNMQVARSIPDGHVQLFAEHLTAKVEEMAGRIRNATVRPQFAAAGVAAAALLAEIDEEEAGRAEPPLSSGIEAYDDMTDGGLYRSDLVVMAGRPGMGKTSAGVTLGYNAACQNEAVGVITIEMPAKQCTAKFASIASGVPYGKFLSKKWTDDGQRRRAREGLRRVGEMPIYINEASYEWADIRSQIRRLNARLSRTEHPLRLVMVDYLGLVEDDSKESRQLAVKNIINGSKRLANELDITIIVLVQINREAEKGKFSRPTKAMLRESGTIENAANVIVLIHREGYYHPEKDQEQATWIIAKNRAFSTGDVDLHWDGPTGTFSDLRYRGPVDDAGWS